MNHTIVIQSAGKRCLCVMDVCYDLLGHTNVMSMVILLLLNIAWHKQRKTWETGGTSTSSSQNLERETLMQIVPQIFKKHCRIHQNTSLQAKNSIFSGEGLVSPKTQIFGPCLLWPNGWMDEAGTWHGGRPQPRQLCVRWEPAPRFPKIGRSLLPNFRPISTVPNGWMRQDATWYEHRPQPRGLCIRWGPNPPPQRGGRLRPPPQKKKSTDVYCGQMAGWVKMALGTEVGLSPGDFVLDGDPALTPPKKRAEPLPNFRPISIVAKRLDASRCHLVWR